MSATILVVDDEDVAREVGDSDPDDLVLASQDDLEAAMERLRAADRRMDYLETHQGIFKLYNRMILTELLLADGKDAEAHGLLAKIRGVNPMWVAEFEDAGLRVIGLERG